MQGQRHRTLRSRRSCNMGSHYLQIRWPFIAPGRIWKARTRHRMLLHPMRLRTQEFPTLRSWRSPRSCTRDTLCLQMPRRYTSKEWWNQHHHLLLARLELIQNPPHSRSQVPLVAFLRYPRLAAFHYHRRRRSSGLQVSTMALQKLALHHRRDRIGSGLQVSGTTQATERRGVC
jgi:hypothetical protein